jgi:hypothetical protein
MKKILIFIFSAFLFGFLMTACKPKVDVEKEKVAIKSVIDGETQAWIDKDGVKYADLYVQDEYQTRADVSGSEVSVLAGWSKRGNVVDSIKNADWSQVKDPKFHHEFLEIKVMDQTAWAIFKYNASAIYKGAEMKQDALQAMVLEKVDGKWKISCFVNASIPIPAPPPPPPPTVKGKKVKK